MSFKIAWYFGIGEPILVEFFSAAEFETEELATSTAEALVKLNPDNAQYKIVDASNHRDIKTGKVIYAIKSRRA